MRYILIILLLTALTSCSQEYIVEQKSEKKVVAQKEVPGFSEFGIPKSDYLITFTDGTIISVRSNEWHNVKIGDTLMFETEYHYPKTDSNGISRNDRN